VKIALIARHVHGQGGVPHHVRALARALAQCHEVTIFSARFEDLEGCRVRHRRICVLGETNMFCDLTFFIGATLVIWWSRRKFPGYFDIIHSHHYGAPFFADLLSSHYCERKGVECMSVAMVGAPGASVLQTFGGRAWASVEGRLFGRATRKPLIVPSESVRRDITGYYGAAAGPIFVIPGGVDPVRYRPENIPVFRTPTRRLHGLAEDDLVVLLVGGDHERKGVARAMEALARVPSSRIHLLIVGPGRRSTYQALARSLGVGGRVIFTGLQKETWKYYAASDIFVLPSLYEPFGLVALEAMATGLPVMTSRQAGVAELIRSGINGLLLEDPRDVADIAANLEMLLADARLRKRLGEEARRTALQYTWAHVAERTVDVYERVLSQSKRAAGDYRGSAADRAHRHAA
jgi:UDP-glucose:(heptosyl)LPS alpha-1,3-glucosyltransferase